MGVDTRAILAFGVYGDEVAPDVFDLEWAKAEEEGETAEYGFYEPDDHPEGGIHTISNYSGDGDPDNAFIGVRLASANPDGRRCTLKPTPDEAWCEAFKAKWGVAPRMALYVAWT